MRSITGTVVKNKMDKSIVVKVDSLKKHPKYNKNYRVSKRFVAHDPENTFNVGDTVTIYEHRPISKTKRWTVVKPSL
ncbi:30S ribosomal protein S17 [Candidatus Peregrinibacteria bacterium CG11_big_fil_rev_8_21_14_0_20_46_8]|nr:MAG: 30S ribosomal protein S17 [Candidatus Peregrinibacteria bacterium CG11_big_fil_rev_8_21_14_0_20_46_8]